MPVRLIQTDITTYPVDAIVNAANRSLLGGGGVDGAIHRAAGPNLLAACKKLGGCQTGEAKRTPAFDLPAKYVIHTVGPIWRDGIAGKEQLLADCYANALNVARQAHCQSISFPAISTGAYGFPHALAAQIAVDTVAASSLDVTLVALDGRTRRHLARALKNKGIPDV